MKTTMCILGICVLTGCATRREEDSQWTRSIAIDTHAGQIEYLDLNGLLMEWSSGKKGHGYLYFSRPGTNDRVWTFPGGLTTGEHKTGVNVYDGDVVTAVHESGRAFKIKIIIQAEYYIKVMYREFNTDREATEYKTDSKKREAEAYRKQGFEHSEAGRYEEAIIAYKKYFAHSKAGRHEKVIMASRDYIPLRQDDLLAYHNMGNAYQSLKQYPEALAAYKKAIDIMPYDAWAYARMGDVYGNLEQYTDAIAAYKKAIDIMPDEAAFAYYNMPDIYGKLEQYTDSIAVHNEGVDIVQSGLHRSLVSAYWNMGNAHSELKQHAEAIAAYKKCIALDPTGKNADSAREGIRRLSRKLRDDINPTTQPADK